MKALIKVGYACNENCTFCHTADLREQNDEAGRVSWKIGRAKRLGYSMVVLSGGEPTIRPELRGWAREVAALGMELGLVTNGLVLSYTELARELIEECRLRYVYMSLHGGEARVHRSVVRADTFANAMRALENLAGRVPDLTANCVVTTANLAHLRGLVDRLAPLPGLTLKFSMTQPKGGGAHAFDFIVPDVEACATRVLEAIEHGRRAAPGLRLAHDGIPLCLLPGAETLYDDLKTHRFAVMVEADEDDFVPVDDVAKVHPPKCEGCALRGPCPGLFGAYLQLRGDGALRPRAGARSNSYHFVPERDLPRSPGAPCPVLPSPTPFDRGRTLFVRLRDRLRVFRTETRDFTDPELLATKEAAGQLYLDVSRKLAPDDFGKDLRKLSPAAECEACPARGRCTGAWEPVREDVFGRDEARLFERLSLLEGRVLDVGAGDGRYLAALAPRVGDGRIRYVAVDPDAQRLGLLASRVPRAETAVCAAEDLDAPGGVGAELGLFDHALFLHSHNHLADPRRAYEGACARLRSGGTLTVVDDVPFGLVRERRQAARAEAYRGFEHLRNDDSGRALERLAGLPLELVHREDVGPSTSNQWTLVLARR